MFPPILWEEIKFHLNLAMSDVQHGITRRLLSSSSTSLKSQQEFINLGSGSRILEGWCNVDISQHAPVRANLRRGLPFTTGSARRIFTEHVLEHFEWEEAVSLVGECYRVLLPGGILRVVVPDGGLYLKWYCNGRGGQFHTSPRCPTAMAVINRVFRQGWQHKYTYDYETLRLLLIQGGFAPRDIKKCSYMQGDSPRLVDNPKRAFESLYMEAAKHQ